MTSLGHPYDELPQHRCEKLREIGDMNKLDKIADEVISSKKIPRGKVRCLDKSILRLAFLGYTIRDIAKEIGRAEETVRYKLNNPAMQTELRRLDKLADVEVLRVDVASKRKVREAAMKAVDILIDQMESKKPHVQMKAAVKILEYAHGKPRQQIDLKATVGDEMTEEDHEALKDDDL